MRNATQRLLLANRDFTLIWGGELLSEMGSQAATVAYPLLILAMTGSASKAGVVGLAKWLPLTIFALPAGVLADRVDRKRLMIATDVIRMLGAASIVALLILGRPPYAQILAVAFLDGAMFVTSYVCERGALRQIVAHDQVQDAVARNEARTFSAGIIGPSLGGVLFSAARVLPFAADTVSYLFSAAAIASTKAPFQKPTGETARPTLKAVTAELGEGFGWLRSEPFFGATAVVAAFLNPMFTGLYLLVILIAKHGHASSTMVGAMLTVVAVCGLLGALLAGPIRRRAGARTIMIGEAWLFVALVLLLAVVREPLLIGLLLGGAEFLSPVANAVVAGSRVAAAPDHLQGRVQSAATMLSMSLAWLGPLAVGFLFERTGATTTVLIIAGWTAALAVGTTLAPAIRHYEGPATPPAAVPTSGR